MTLAYPDWAGFTPAFAEAELARLLPLAEAGVAAVEASEPKDYDELMLPLEDATRELMRVWRGVAHMLSVMNAPAWRELEDAWREKLITFSLRIEPFELSYADKSYDNFAHIIKGKPIKTT